MRHVWQSSTLGFTKVTLFGLHLGDSLESEGLGLFDNAPESLANTVLNFNVLFGFSFAGLEPYF